MAAAAMIILVDLVIGESPGVSNEKKEMSKTKLNNFDTTSWKRSFFLVSIAALKKAAERRSPHVIRTSLFDANAASVSSAAQTSQAVRPENPSRCDTDYFARN